MTVLGSPWFWAALCAAGYLATLASLGPGKMRHLVYTRIPKGMIVAFMMIFIMLPPVALPFARGPKIGLPLWMAAVAGGAVFAANVVIKIMSQKKIGAVPALKQKGTLVTDGIYRVVRHPLYMSNGMLALGMALLMNSLYALLFSIPYSLGFLLIIHFEERMLIEQYGEEYRAYQRRVPWRMIPKLI
ncbi:MAG: isoprenylcysteine carboxylmethyltransferase family protein [Desulfobacteraceae bacterium]|jgi:protein-S-isoprenylcysteine O-methyltransferase Ste14